MSQPASMFDVGLIRIKNITDWAERLIAGYWVKGHKVLLNVNVGYYDEQIHVSIATQSTYGQHIELTEAQMQEGCDRSLSFVVGNVSKFVPQVFLPRGDTDRAKWKDLRQQLLPLLRFSCQVYGSDGEVLYQAEQR
ncbi:MAG: hypothetical protein AAGA23_06445 [Pseudomonadota bacterium]